MASINLTHVPSYNVSPLVLGPNSSVSPSVSAVQSEASRGIQITATILIFLVRLLRLHCDSNRQTRWCSVRRLRPETIVRMYPRQGHKLNQIFGSDYGLRQVFAVVCCASVLF